MEKIMVGIGALVSLYLGYCLISYSVIGRIDGRHIAYYTNRDGNWEIYIMNTDGTEPINLTLDPAYDQCPAWSPDSQQLAFASDRTGNFEILKMNVDGSNVVNLTNNPADDEEPAWRQ